MTEPVATASGSAHEAPPERLVPRAWRLLLLLVFVLVVLHDLGYMFPAPGTGRLEGLAEFYGGADRVVTVSVVTPGGPMARAGLRAGDRIRFERPGDEFRTGFPLNDVVPLTVLREDGEQRIDLRPAARDANGQTIVLGGSLFVIALIGLLIATRRQRRLDGFLLGGALICLALSGSYSTSWESLAPAILPFSTMVWLMIMAANPVLLLAFARLQHRELRGGAEPAMARWVFWGVLGLNVILALPMGVIYPPLNTATFNTVSFATIVATQALAVAVLFWEWRRATGEARTRLGFLFIGCGAMFLGLNGVGFYITLTGADWSFRNPAVAIDLGLTFGGTLILAYAILRHKVVDLGFALNRTLVYAVLSTVMLFGFWLAEWGLEKIIPEETREANILISAGVAFVIFLFFHHLRDWVEKGVEHLFFRGWRENEARLKRFLKDAAFVARSETLETQAIAALSAFGLGAAVALFRADEAGAALGAGDASGWPDRFDIDAPFLVRLRSTRELVRDQALLPAGAALVLPMTYRSEITGFFVLGPKPTGEVWRPDEEVLLADAALRIGLDLHALEVERLRAEHARERQRAEILATELAKVVRISATA